MTAQPELALGWPVVRFSGLVPQKFDRDGLDRTLGCRDSRLYRDPKRDRPAGNPPCSRTIVPCAPLSGRSIRSEPRVSQIREENFHAF